MRVYTFQCIVCSYPVFLFAPLLQVFTAPTYGIIQTISGHHNKVVASYFAKTNTRTELGNWTDVEY